MTTNEHRKHVASGDGFAATTNASYAISRSRPAATRRQ